MIEKLFQPRIIENKDWASLLFILSFALIALARLSYGNRFADLVNLLFSDKYLKIYRDTSNLTSAFTVVMFCINMISLAFFIQLVLAYFNIVSKTDWIVFIQIITSITVFVLAKFLIEKIIATSFNIEELIEHYNLQKVSYRTYVGLLLLPVDLFLFYNNFLTKHVIYGAIVIFLIINLINYVISLRNYQKLLFSRVFYFILYLCALEIAPYYFLYYWFTKS